jgi:hypothetical protein
MEKRKQIFNHGTRSMDLIKGEKVIVNRRKTTVQSIKNLDHDYTRVKFRNGMIGLYQKFTNYWRIYYQFGG